jgi:hypothetical protein
LLSGDCQIINLELLVLMAGGDTFGTFADIIRRRCLASLPCADTSCRHHVF